VTASWWCPICATPITDPEWLPGARPAPYHRLRQSMHAVQAPDNPTPHDFPGRRETVVKHKGRLIVLEPGEMPPS
jgi:hypothetical protein